MSLAAVFGASNSTRACMHVSRQGARCWHPVAGTERMPGYGAVDLCPTHLAEARQLLASNHKEAEATKMAEATKSQRILDILTEAGTALRVEVIAERMGDTVSNAESLCAALFKQGKVTRVSARTYGIPKGAVDVGIPILQISGRAGHYSAEVWPAEYKTHRRVVAPVLAEVLSRGVREVDQRIVVLHPAEEGGYVVVGPDGLATQGDTLAAAARALVEAITVAEDAVEVGRPVGVDRRDLLDALGLSVDLSVPEAVEAAKVMREALTAARHALFARDGEWVAALGLDPDLASRHYLSHAAAMRTALAEERQAAATLRDQLAAVRAELANEQATSTALQRQVAAAHTTFEQLRAQVAESAEIVEDIYAILVEALGTTTEDGAPISTATEVVRRLRSAIERADLLEGERRDLQRTAAARGDALDAIRSVVGGEEIDCAHLASFVAHALAGAKAHAIPGDAHRVAYLEGWQERQREIDALYRTAFTRSA